MTGKQVANFFGAGGAPSTKDIASALQTKAQEARPVDSGGVPFLRLVSGLWVYGQDDVEVEEGSEWAINPLSVATGYIAWKDAKVIGEHMAKLGEPSIDASELDQDLGKHTKGDRKGQAVSWDQQISFILQCVSGEDEGQSVIYKTTSHGGKKEASRIIEEIAKQASNDPENIVPIVELETDSYKHSEYGKTFTPDMQLKRFISMTGEAESAVNDGDDEDNADTDETDAPKKTKERRRVDKTKRTRAASKPKDEETAEDKPEEATPKASTGRRRRRRP